MAKKAKGLLDNICYHLMDDGIQKIISEYTLKDWEIVLEECEDPEEQELIKEIIQLWPGVQRFDALLTDMTNRYDDDYTP